MTGVFRRLIACAFALSLLMWAAPDSAADPAADSVQIWVDLDGDGFDDNAPDSDANGIPDEFQPGVSKPAPAGPATTGIFAGMATPEEVVFVPLSASEEFGKRKFSVRALSENRAGMSSGFSELEGISGGMAGGGHGCAGGVCW